MDAEFKKVLFALVANVSSRTNESYSVEIED
jgi:hypothetical protein